LRRRLFTIVSGLALALTPLLGGDVPRPSQEYAIKLTTGQQLLLSQFRGDVVMLMFVSTTCPHCQQTTQFVERLKKEYGPRGFRPIAVAFNEMAVMLVPDFAKQLGLTYPVGYDSRDPVFEFLQRSPMLRTYVPILVFIDRKGMIRGQYMGDDKFLENQQQNIRKTVEELLKEPAASSSKGHSKKKSS
jgi:thiol-disulfide isomerase/thioredoxin